MKKQAMLKWVFGGSLVIIGVIIGLSLSTNGKSGHQNALLTDQAVAAEPPAELHTTADLNDAFISVSKAVLPAVVSIATSQIVKQPDINTSGDDITLLCLEIEGGYGDRKTYCNDWQ